jgi:hypothetical protein
MCTFVMGIGMLVFGIIALVRGQFSLTRTKVVTGVPARIIGLILLLPLPLMLVGGLLIGIVYAAQGKQPTADDLRGVGIVLELGVILTCFLVAVIIAGATAQPPKRRRPRDDEDEEDRDEEPRPRRYAEDEEDQPRRRRADEDEGPRPRRPDDRYRE